MLNENSFFFFLDLSFEYDLQVILIEEVEEEKCFLFVYFGYFEDFKEINVLFNIEVSNIVLQLVNLVDLLNL